MALTPAEKQRRYREKKETELKKAQDQARAYLKRPFCDFVANLDDTNDPGSHNEEAEYQTFEEFSFLAGVTFQDFREGQDVDIDYEPYLKHVRTCISDDEDFIQELLASRGPTGNSLAKAEHMRMFFEHGHMIMCRLLNRYKREEIEARIAEIEAQDLSDPAVRKAALADVVRLNKLLDRLKKEVRFSYPVTEIKG